MFELMKKMFSVLLSSLVHASNHTECVSLSNQPTINNSNPNLYSQ